MGKTFSYLCCNDINVGVTPSNYGEVNSVTFRPKTIRSKTENEIKDM